MAVEADPAREVVEELIGANGAADADVEHPDLFSCEDEPAAHGVKLEAAGNVRFVDCHCAWLGSLLRSTISAAMSWSLRFWRCDARRRTSNACSDVCPSRAMRMPLAWPMMSRCSRATVRLRARSAQRW